MNNDNMGELISLVGISFVIAIILLALVNMGSLLVIIPTIVLGLVFLNPLTWMIVFLMWVWKRL